VSDTEVYIAYKIYGTRVNWAAAVCMVAFDNIK